MKTGVTKFNFLNKLWGDDIETEILQFTLKRKEELKTLY